jgi:ankyrin repeat protein
MHQQTDCIPLVLSKGVSILALDAQGRSALQLTCLCCDTATVQLLLDSGGWLDNYANSCLLYAVNWWFARDCTATASERCCVY